MKSATRPRLGDGEGNVQRLDASNLWSLLHRRLERGPTERLFSTFLSSPVFPLSGGRPLKICAAANPYPLRRRRRPAFPIFFLLL
jgi:hypothetical protein